MLLWHSSHIYPWRYLIKYENVEIKIHTENGQKKEKDGKYSMTWKLYYH